MPSCPDMGQQKCPAPGEEEGWQGRVWAPALLRGRASMSPEAGLLICAVTEQDRGHPHCPCEALGTQWAYWLAGTITALP